LLLELNTLLPQCLLSDWVRLGRWLGRLLRDDYHPDAATALPIFSTASDKVDDKGSNLKL
jgi:hypothetical protein